LQAEFAESQRVAALGIAGVAAFLYLRYLVRAGAREAMGGNYDFRWVISD